MRPQIAIRIILFLLIAVMLFHIGILLKIIPYDIAWGGRLKNNQEMYVFEFISIAINLFLFLILLIKGNYVRPILSKKTVNAILYVFILLFILNTIGNLLAKTTFEKCFALLTLASAILIWIALKNGDKQMMKQA